ncbi:MAG TPA: riboflavin synthase [Nitrospinota bacterium]|nr:riboflavin synthase [Nitrospinota bacterium]
MFTGIIEQAGKIKSFLKRGNQAKITIEFHESASDLTLGESIAVNGVCLTVVKIGNGYFATDISEETLDRTNLGELKPTDKVNLERSLKIGERLGGHFVSGHIDGVGRISKKIRKGEEIVLTIKAPEKIMKYVVEKGSIAVDGISLTVASCDEKSITISIISHTEVCTNLKWKKSGDVVNLENDMIGKYIEKFVNLKNRNNGGKSKISKEFLAAHGF